MHQHLALSQVPTLGWPAQVMGQSKPSVSREQLPTGFVVVFTAVLQPPLEHVSVLQVR
jgi:hypothetical protein